LGTFFPRKSSHDSLVLVSRSFLYLAPSSSLSYPFIFCPVAMMITLDEIIPYQPPLPPKPSIPSKIIPPPSKLPPLIHPLPQKPHSRHQSPSDPSQLLHQSRSHPISSPIDQESRAEVPSYQNVFDSELAVEATAIVSAATENTGQQPQCRSGSKGLEDNLRKQPPGKYG
jgi:hypothetical protein